MSRRTYSNDPRAIIARFPSQCAETGRPIKKGDTIIYYPSSRQAFCLDSNQARQYNADRFDMDQEDRWNDQQDSYR